MTKKQRLQLETLKKNRTSRTKNPVAFFVDQKGKERPIAEKLSEAGILDLVSEKQIGSKKNQIHYKLYRINQFYINN